MDKRCSWFNWIQWGTGYRTNELDSKDYSKRKEQAIKVANAMKRDGWTFASHSWGTLILQIVHMIVL